MRPVPALILALSLSGAARAQPAYWQQKVDTRLEVQLDDRKHFLHGFETLTYTNNSPDTLRYLYFHLWPNAYKHDRTTFTEQQLTNGSTDFYYSKPAERGYIDSLQFNIDGQQVDYFSNDNLPDIARLDLLQPIVPGQTVTITTPFRVKIPIVFSRLGHTGQSYYISQWFPKPAVYDRKGWHPMPYLDQGEFFAEIGSYEVSITLPANYVVMATGNCLDESENARMDSLSRQPVPDYGLGSLKQNTAAKNDSLRRRLMNPKSSPELKTLHFREDNIHDFAWFADKRFIVRKDSFAVPGTDQTVMAWAAFLPGSKAWDTKGPGYIREGIEHYSRWIGPYPYKTAKAVQGDMKAGGGMEYPTVTVIDRTITGSDLRSVIVHEVGHNWFQGILATNERDHAWMDEGLNTLYEQKTVAAVTRDSAKQALRRISESEETIAWHELANTNEDQPVEQTSTQFRELNYGLDVYYKTALYTRWLENWMGPERFETAMHEYFDTWKHRHPYPEDFEAIIRKHAQQDPGWYFQGLRGTDRVDFRIRNVRQLGDSLLVSVKNKSGFRGPALLKAYNDDTAYLAVSEPFTGTRTIALRTPDNWRSVIIAPEVPDNNSHNNIYRRHGLFHHARPQLRPLLGFNRGFSNTAWWLPALGYNEYDGVMLGVLLQNAFTIPENRFRFVLAPLYGFRSGTFAGAGSVGYAWFPKRAVKEVLLQTDVKTFHYDQTEFNVQDPLYARYLKVAPGLHLTFKERNPVSPVTRTLSLKGYWIQEEYFNFRLDPSDSLYKPSIRQQEKVYGTLRYQHKNERAVNPFSYSLESQLGKDFAKINLEGKVRVDYHAKGKSLYVRAYAGKFFSIGDDPFASDRYYLNTTFSGPNDYLYDDTYIGRNEREGLSSRQVSIREGGFKLATPFYANQIGRSDNWLAALNIATDLPLKKLPLRLYLDVATFSDADKLNPSGNKVLYMGGIELHLPYDVVSVYFPLVMSSDYKDYLKSIYGKDIFGHSITFKLQLHNINWLKAPRWGLKQVI